MVLTSVVCLLSSNRNPQPASFQVETHTAATVEVDVMPFLGRADWGGPFNAYYEALANLGSEYGDSRPFYTGCHVLFLFPKWSADPLRLFRRCFQSATHPGSRTHEW